MAKNQIQHGAVLALIAGAAGVVSGTPLLVGNLFVVPVTSAVDEETYEAELTGVWEFPKTTANVVTAGARAYWNDTAKEVTTTVGSNTLVGVFTEARINGDELAYVRLNGVSV